MTTDANGLDIRRPTTETDILVPDMDDLRASLDDANYAAVVATVGGL